MRRFLLATAVGALFLGVAAGPALACGGLIGRNGAVNLIRTTTLAAYADGVEHYVTSFQFAGAGGEFGSIVPLPGIPTNVERGGDWTLQRLVREVTPVREVALAVSRANSGASSDAAEVLLKTQVDALDLTVLRGGAASIGEWAAQNGFLLPPDAPEVLDFYAQRSPIFLAAKFDADAARQRGTAIGDGTPVHLTIPTDNPWVPLRILALGRQPQERVEADVFLLTPDRPTLLPGFGARGLSVERFEPASDGLLADLRSDKGMDWVPADMWLSFLRVSAAPGDLTYDLAVDATGAGQPSRVAAGLEAVGVGGGGGSGTTGDGGNVGTGGNVGGGNVGTGSTGSGTTGDSGPTAWPLVLAGVVAAGAVFVGVLAVGGRRSSPVG
jgi:hypothetical protein